MGPSGPRKRDCHTVPGARGSRLGACSFPALLQIRQMISLGLAHRDDLTFVEVALAEPVRAALRPVNRYLIALRATVGAQNAPGVEIGADCEDLGVLTT